MSGLALLANLGFAGFNGPRALAYRRALGRVRSTQTRLLQRYLRRNADTEYGRRFGFADIRTADEYRARVPVTTYDDYSDYVDRIGAGESNVLTREPVKLLEWSSGSTRAAKLIPFTSSLQAEFARAVGAWITDLFASKPSLAGGTSYWSVSPAYVPPSGEGATLPIGFMDDSQYLGGPLARLMNAALAVPGTLSRVRDVALHRRLTLLHLLGRQDLRLISVWHPSFLALLVEALRDEWDDLLSAVATGGLLGPEIRLPARPRRARELESLDPTDLEAIWPRLALISCWTDGPARHSVTSLRERFPNVTIQGKGLLATEGVVSIPFAGHRPLAVTSHFFEFLDVDDRAHPAWEVERGAEYSVVLTTGGGLYRYRLEDLVRIVDFAGEAPSIEFVSKERHVSDLVGEKLSQGFVQAILDRLLADHAISPTFAMLAPEADGSTPRYLLFVHSRRPLPPEFIDDLEQALRENPNYAHCVRLGQLRPAAVAMVARDADRRYLSEMVRLGRRLGDVKPIALSPTTGWSEVLRSVPSEQTEAIE